MEENVDIYKAAGILIKDRKFLIVRSKGKKFFMSPGGKIESGETARGALVRELREELQIEVNESDLSEFGTFDALATGMENSLLRMDVFMVEKWHGEIVPASEIDEILWVDSHLPDIELSSIFLHDVLPKLKQLDLID